MSENDHTSQIKAELKMIYNQYANHRNDSTKQPWKMAARDEFLKHLKEDSIKNLLELGAGTGQDSLFFQESGLEVTAIDLSEEHVEFSKKRGINAHVMDFYNLNFQSESFDSLYSLNALLHVPKEDISSVLTELKRVMKTDGLFFLGVYGGKDFEGINDKDNYEDKRFFAFYNFNTYKQILENHFKLIQANVVPLEKDFEFHYFILKKLK